MSTPICPIGREIGCEECVIYRYLQLYSKGLITYTALMYRLLSSRLPQEWKRVLIENPSPQIFESLVSGSELITLNVNGYEVKVKPPVIITFEKLEQCVRFGREHNIPVEVSGYVKAPIKVMTFGRLFAKLVDRDMRYVRNYTYIIPMFSSFAKLIYAFSVVEGINVITLGFKFVVGEEESDEFFRLSQVINRLRGVSKSEIPVDVALEFDEVKYFNNLCNCVTHYANRGGNYERVVKLLGIDCEVGTSDNYWWLPRVDRLVEENIEIVNRLVDKWGFDRATATRLARLYPITTTHKVKKALTIIQAKFGTIENIEELLLELGTPPLLVKIVKEGLL